MYDENRGRVDVYKNVIFDWSTEYVRNNVGHTLDEEFDDGHSVADSNEEADDVADKLEEPKKKTDRKVRRTRYTRRSTGTCVQVGAFWWHVKINWRMTGAMIRDNRREWKVMDEEISSLKEDEVYELDTLPESRKIIDSRWVFKIKERSDGKVVQGATCGKRFYG